MTNSPDVILRSGIGERMLGYAVALVGASWLTEFIYGYFNGIDLRHSDLFWGGVLVFAIGVSEIVLCHTLKVSISPNFITYRAYFKSFRIEKSEITQIVWNDKIGFRRSRGIEFVCGDQVRAIPFYGLSDSDRKLFIDYVKSNYTEFDQLGWENLPNYYEQLKERERRKETQTPALMPAIASAVIALMLIYISFSPYRQGDFNGISFAVGLGLCSIIFIRDSLIYAGTRVLGEPLFPRYIPHEYRKRATIILLLTLATTLGLGIAAWLDADACVLVTITCVTFLLWVLESSKHGPATGKSA